MVDGDSKRLYDVMPDDHNLRTGVEDCRDLDTAIDEDVKLLEGETECRWSVVGEELVRGVIFGDIMHHCAMCGWRKCEGRGRDFGGHCLIFVSFHMLHLESFDYVLVNDGTGSKNVSRSGQRELALHEKVLKLRH